MKRHQFWCALAVMLAGACASVATAQSPGTLCSQGTIGPKACIRPEHVRFDICQHIAGASRRHLIDPGFFARLLWQESRFDPNALSPAGAQGIAQFMPATAKRRGLRDSYNPAEAMERSAHYLGALVRRYGNPGLAAVAYNGGEARADGFLRGGGLARETVDYVRIITGLSAEDWRDAPPEDHSLALEDGSPFFPACLRLAAGQRISTLKPPPRQGRFRPWGVQLTYGTTRTEAEARLRRATQSCRARVRAETVDFVPIKSRKRSQPPYLMGRIGRNTREAADALCRDLARAGCRCRVYENPR